MCFKSRKQISILSKSRTALVFDYQVKEVNVDIGEGICQKHGNLWTVKIRILIPYGKCKGNIIFIMWNTTLQPSTYLKHIIYWVITEKKNLIFLDTNERCSAVQYNEL